MSIGIGVRNAAMLLLLVAAGVAHADESLWCQVETGDLPGVKAAAKPAKLTEFVWNTAHGGMEPTGPIKTYIGTIEAGEGPHYTTAITLNGKPVALPSGTTGLIWSGKVYDFSGTVALAYQVERADDSSASPSDVVVVIEKDGLVSQSAVLPGTEPPPADHCFLD